MTPSRCEWYMTGRGYCGQPATHTHFNRDRGDEEKDLCKYHVGVARRDGWTSIYKIASCARRGSGASCT